MNIGPDYAKLISQKYKNVLVTPLIGAWEFMDKPMVLNWQKDWERLRKMSIHYNWRPIQIDLQNILKSQEKTIVVTDVEQIILFASSEFETMTGYNAKEAIGRKPSFLQGRDTDIATKTRIREAIQTKVFVSETLLNYKKDGSPYLCKVEIHPVFNSEKELVSFIAVESEVETKS